MLNSLFHNKDSSFENFIWLIACTIATIRAILGVIDDVIQPDTNIYELGIDLLLLGGFASAGYGLYSGRIKKVPVAISLVLICLLAINFIQFGGVHGQSEFNLLGMTGFLILAHKKKQLIYLLPIHLVVTILVVIDNETNGPLTQQLYLQETILTHDFWYTTMALLILVLFFKSSMVEETNRLIRLNQLKLERIKDTEDQTAHLKKQAKELNETNQQLRNEFIVLTEDISKHDISIRNFVKVTQKTLDEPFKVLLDDIQKLESYDYLTDKIKETGAEIEELRKSLKQTN